MSIIFSEDGLRDIQPPCIVQAFVNHNARLFKIFIIGRRRFIIQRPSIKNLSAGGSYIIPKFPLFLFFLLHLMSWVQVVQMLCAFQATAVFLVNVS